MNFINKKDPTLKKKFHTNCKNYIQKFTLQPYIKNTWERNQILYFSKNCSFWCTNCISLYHGDTITNPYDIANTFNNYFASIAEKSKKYSHEHFSDYLMNESGSTIFLQPTDIEKIANTISSLSSNKASSPNSIP